MSADISAAPKQFRLGDKSYNLHPFNDEDLAEIENWGRSILVQRAFDALPKDLTTQERLQLRSNIATDISSVTILDRRMHLLLCSYAGIVHMCFLGLRQDPQANKDNVTEEQVKKAFLDPVNVSEWVDAYNDLNPNFLKLRQPRGKPEASQQSAKEKQE